MSETNHLTITGTIIEIGSRRVSPAGIPQQRFTLEHRSRQIEAGIPREARCRVDVKVAGEDLTVLLKALDVGQQVQVEGFLTRNGYKGSEASIVVHATGITTTGDAAD